MPKAKPTRSSKRSDKKDYERSSGKKTSSGSETTRNSTPTTPKTSEIPGTESVTGKDIIIIAGSYEKLLYGINGHWLRAGDDGYEQDKPSLRLEPIFIFPAHSGCIKTVAVGGRHLASGSTDEVIKLYDIKKRKEVGSLLQHEGSITTLQFYGKSHMLSGSEDGTICIWRTRDWECLKTLKGHKGRVNYLSVHPSGKMALSVSIDKTVRLWDLLVGQKASVINLGRGIYKGEVVLWSPSGEQYAILTTHEIVLYNISDAKIAQKFQLQNSRYLCMQYHTHESLGDLLIAGCEDKTVRIYDIKRGDCIAKLMGHKNRIKSMSKIHSAPPNHPTPVALLTSISSDGVINIWSLDEILAKKGQTEPLTSYDTRTMTVLTVWGPLEAADVKHPIVKSHTVAPYIVVNHSA
ncbi:5202_t:CDS:2 [Acaulospora colombiana]|uniref:5202_t:CDS:1 n=1 Tax=Acaulospora colombiana TaxID=27376 RepID=A0ACA9KPX9_9GLOM|nr:5202_t:CDS:2 [Acaulospora colombiana]